MVFYSTWEMGIHRDRKLFAYSFLSGMGRLRIIVTGNYLRMVSIRHGAVVYHSDRKLFGRRFLDSASLRSK